MSHDVLSLILDNAKNLRESSRILEQNNKLSHAGHFAVYSIEECAKCLMKTLALQQLYKDKDSYDHYRKEDAIESLWYILGKLSVVYILEYLSNSNVGDQQWRSTTKIISDVLANSSIDLYSEHAKKSFSDFNDRINELEVKKIYKFDKIRKHSVYANPHTGKLDSVNNDEIKKCIEFAEFTIELMSMIINKDFCWNRFFKIAPKEITEEMTSSAESILKKMKAKGH